MLLLTNVEAAIARQVADEASMRFEARTSAHDPRHARKLSMPSTHYTHRISAIRCVRGIWEKRNYPMLCVSHDLTSR